MARILVINPNSSTQTTAAMEGIASLRVQGGAAIECVTMAEGPPGIETQEHVEVRGAAFGEAHRTRARRALRHRVLL